MKGIAEREQLGRGGGFGDGVRCYGFHPRLVRITDSIAVRRIRTGDRKALRGHVERSDRKSEARLGPGQIFRLRCAPLKMTTEEVPSAGGYRSRADLNTLVGESGGVADGGLDRFR